MICVRCEERKFEPASAGGIEIEAPLYFVFGNGTYLGRSQLSIAYEGGVNYPDQVPKHTLRATLHLRWIAFSPASDFCNPILQVTLPPKDPVLAPGLFSDGVFGPRHFDFSDAPDVPGFNSSSECAGDYTLGGSEAYNAFLARSESQTMLVPRH